MTTICEPGSGTPGPGGLPDALRVAAIAVIGDRFDLAERYATLLATDGVLRGLIGPHEASRVWDRHILNCAAMASLIPDAAYVVDVGSGAGLPGIPLAIARSDIEVVLIEPLARRVTFLAEVLGDLGITGQVHVVRGRAEEITGGRPQLFHVKPADVVTARAVAPLDRLTGWCLPLATIGGRLLAMKGSSATQEIEVHEAAIARAGGGTPILHRCGTGLLETPTTVVEIRKVREPAGSTPLQGASSKPAARRGSGTRRPGHA